MQKDTWATKGRESGTPHTAQDRQSFCFTAGWVIAATGGYQVPAIVSSGYRAVLIDSRGHGRSTRDDRTYTYHLMASDVLAVMDTPHLDAILDRCIGRHAKDYAQLSATPERFKDFVDSFSAMQMTQPNYSAQDLKQIKAPVLMVQGEYDEFIKREHAEYLARTIPGHARFHS